MTFKSTICWVNCKFSRQQVCQIIISMCIMSFYNSQVSFKISTQIKNILICHLFEAQLDLQMYYLGQIEKFDAPSVLFNAVTNPPYSKVPVGKFVTGGPPTLTSQLFPSLGFTPFSITPTISV